MILLVLLLGLLLPALTGWLLLELIQGKARVLWRAEQWVLGCVLGLTLVMFCAFFGNRVLAVPFTLAGFLGVFGALLLAFGIPWFLGRTRRRAVEAEPPAADQPALRQGSHSTDSTGSPQAGSGQAGQAGRPLLIALIVVCAWIALRIVTLGSLAFVTPSFFDDTMDNWNLRGKLFFFEETFTLEFPWGGTSGIHSYPPTMPLVKAWASTLAGGWHEGLANGVHLVSFLALLALLFWTLRRRLPFIWSLLGTAMLASLPLELMHGVNAYADVFLSVHLFAAVALTGNALQSHTREQAQTWLRLAALAIALVPFTKNEGWALYFPLLVLLYGWSTLWLRRTGALDARALMRTMAFAAAMVFVFVLPWIGFKVLHDLPFGNAKDIDWQFRWQPGVLTAIVVNTFFEGNWNLLFPLTIGLLLLRWRTVLRPPLLLLTACVLIPYGIQLFFYLFTGLSQEAILQTGYARGLIHLMPVIVTLTTLLLRDAVSGDRRYTQSILRSCPPTPPSSATSRT